MNVSDIDKNHYKLLRDNITNFIQNLSKLYDNEESLILDVAPETHKGAKEFFKLSKIKVLDIDPKSNADYILDLCNNNSGVIPDNTFDLILCTEVLEHTNNPFNVVAEIHRILKSGGVAAISTPFNFRIHGPLPDNWRFTVHGLKVLFSEFEILELNELEDADRFLMPIQYTLVARKK
jgi:SAM-dependent methyltransferase